MKPLLVPDVLEGVIWNLEDGRKPGDVAGDVDRMLTESHDPHFVLFQESRRYTQAIRHMLHETDRDYRVSQKTGWPEAGNCTILVRPQAGPVVRFGALRMTERWVGPHALNPHAPRTFPFVDLGYSTDPNKLRLVDVHMPPGGPTGGVITKGRNKAAYAEAAAGIVELAGRAPSNRRGLFLGGDWNAEAGDKHPTAPAGIAREIGGRLVRAGGGPDMAIARGCTARGRRGRNHGSDHPYRSFTIRSAA